MAATVRLCVADEAFASLRSYRTASASAFWYGRVVRPGKKAPVNNDE